MSAESTSQAGTNLGVATVSAGIAHLWKKTASRLTTEELEWFAGYTEEAEREGQNLASIVMDIGCLVGADTSAGNFRHQSSVSTLLFSISHQIDTINGMLYMGSSAGHRLRDPELYQRIDAAEGGNGGAE